MIFLPAVHNFPFWSSPARSLAPRTCLVMLFFIPNKKNIHGDKYWNEFPCIWAESGEALGMPSPEKPLVIHKTQPVGTQRELRRWEGLSQRGSVGPLCVRLLLDFLDNCILFMHSSNQVKTILISSQRLSLWSLEFLLRRSEQSRTENIPNGCQTIVLPKTSCLQCQNVTTF